MMMRILKLTVAMLLLSVTTLLAQGKEVSIQQSEIVWTGTKVGGAHTGLIQLKSGQLRLDKEGIVDGYFEIDMNSMTNTDIEAEGVREKLIGHLKSDDFFGVATYPSATFKITQASPFVNGMAKVSGEVTIKGKTETIHFNVKHHNDRYTARIEVDRSKFDVRYGSKSFFNDLGDKVIHDIFTLDVKLVL